MPDFFRQHSLFLFECTQLRFGIFEGESLFFNSIPERSNPLCLFFRIGQSLPPPHEPIDRACFCEQRPCSTEFGIHLFHSRRALSYLCSAA